jgi:hypothetical protein
MLELRKVVVWSFAASLFLLFVSVAAAQAQSPRNATRNEAETAAAKRKAALEEFVKDAQTYEITLQAARPIALTLLAQPVLNWDGSAFVWLRDGRPEVIGAFWTNIEPRTGRVRHPHAFHSLSEYPIQAEFESKRIWNPSGPGLKFRPVDGAMEPADKPWRRLVQMRELAREFSVKGTYPRYEEMSARPLRMLTNPIFRYEPTSGDVQDGAIFVCSADVVTIDPDALLVIESRRTDGRFRWEYAFARFHYIELTGYHRESQVWKVENEWPEPRQHAFGDGPGREKVYYSVERRP